MPSFGSLTKWNSALVLHILRYRLLEEVDDVVGKKSFISNDDISKLSFSSLLIKEALRLYSIVPGILRYVVKESILDGLRIPADSELLVRLWVDPVCRYIYYVSQKLVFALHVRISLQL